MEQPQATPDENNAANDPMQPRWTELPPTERRVLAVLVEKAKTTPDNYPITIAALTAGCNQKSNRDPQMQLDQDDVEISLDRLRSAGVVVEVQGSGRVPKYRHTAYDWFDVKGHEIAVLTELLLRGPQTAGELRTRASRMETFADLGQMQQTLDLLQSKNLVLPMSPPGRGQQFAHNVYQKYELEQLRKHSAVSAASMRSPAQSSPAQPAAAQKTDPSEIQQLRDEVASLRDQVAELRERLDVIES